MNGLSKISDRWCLVNLGKATRLGVRDKNDHEQHEAVSTNPYQPNYFCETAFCERENSSEKKDAVKIETRVESSVTRKKSPNVYINRPKMISLEK